MGRLLLIVALVALGFWWVSARLRRPPGRDGQGPAAAPPRDMVACAHCGVHLPRDEAVADGQRLFCGDAHRRLGPRAE